MTFITRTVGQPFAVRPLTGDISSGNARSNRPAAHLFAHDYIAMVWESAGDTDLWLLVDFGAPRSIDFVGLLAANAAAATQIRVRLGDTQAEVEGVAPYDSGVVNFIDPAITLESGLYNSHLELPAIEARRWMRIDVTGHTGDFSAAQLIAGKKISSDHFYNPGTEFGVEDLGSFDLSRFGVADIAHGEIMRTIRIRYAWTGEDVYENDFRALFEGHGTTRPFYLCFEPQAHAYRQARTYFGWFKDIPVATGARVASRMEMEISLVSQV